MAAPTLPPDEDTSVLTRLRRGAAELGCSGAELAALGLLLAGAVAVLAVLWVLARPSAGPGDVRPGDVGPGDVGPQAPAELALTDEEIVVHVAGHVVAPGLYRLPGGARVADALEQAGGPLADAVLDALNLARPLSDGEQLLVPGPAPPGDSGTGEAEHAPASAWRPDGLLDLNRATAEDFEQLPGIGPVLAERLVDHREQVGGFQAVGDLRDVTGIGEKKFQGLADLVTV